MRTHESYHGRISDCVAATISMACFAVLCGCVHDGRHDRAPDAEQVGIEQLLHSSPAMTNTITKEWNNVSVGRVAACVAENQSRRELARPDGTFEGHIDDFTEILVDARFRETNVYFRAIDDTGIDVLRKTVGLDHLAVSPSREILYIGPVFDAQRARSCAAVLSRHFPDAMELGMCCSIEPSHLTTDRGQNHVISKIFGEKIQFRVDQTDVRGFVQGTSVGFHTAADYLWILVSLSSTVLIEENNRLVIVPVSDAESEGAVATNACSTCYSTRYYGD